MAVDPNIPVLIGFRVLNTSKPMVAFICGECLKPHVYRDNGGAIQRFESKCPEAPQADTFDLLIVGAVPGPRDLPFPGEDDEVSDLNRLLAAVPRQHPSCEQNPHDKCNR